MHATIVEVHEKRGLLRSNGTKRNQRRNQKQPAVGKDWRLEKTELPSCCEGQEMAQGAREQLSGLVAARPHITSARTGRIPHAAIRAEDPPATPLQSVCGLGRHAKLPPSEGAVWGCTPMPEAVAHRHIGT